MGTKYALPGITEDSPTHVEGVRLWLRPTELTGDPCHVNLIVIYWDGATELARRLVEVWEGKVLANGGTHEEWETVRACADNPSDIDDVVENMTETTWGKSILWGCWRGIQGQ